MKEELKGYADSSVEALEVKIKDYADSGDEKLEAVVEAYAHSEDEQLESRLHEWLDKNKIGFTLEGSNAGPDRGMVYYNSRPLCSEDIGGTTTWDLDDATVVCRMLGFSKATKSYQDFDCSSIFGSCPPAGIPFAMSGFKCTGSENHILDCPHDSTVSSYCGTNGGFTYGDGSDIVGVKCE